MLAAGTVIAGHELLAPLGKGGQGEVHRARAPDGREVALKVLAAAAPGGEAIGRFKREMRLLCSLDHPRVVRAFATGEERGRLWIACELASGGTLADRLRERGRLAQSEAVDMLADLVAGLVALADAGIAHRDVKPSNLLAFAGGWKLGDLGLARRYDPDGSSWTGSGHVVGTPAYIAPELVCGEAAGFASDVYAAGCVLHQCLTGEPPYRGPDAMAVLRQHLEAPPADPGRERTGLHPALRELNLELLDKNLQRRPGDPAVLLRRIAAVRRAVAEATDAGEAPTRRMAETADSSAEIAPSTVSAPGLPAAAPAEALAHARLAIPGGMRLHAWAGSALTFGRERGDRLGWHVRSILLPEAAHAALSKRISGRHFALSLAEGRCLVEDLGSSWGTRLAGTRLRPREAVAVADGAELDLAGALTLRLRVLPGGAVLAQRLGNAPDLAYLLVAGSAGLSADLAGPGDALVLSASDGGLHAGGRPLRDGDILALPSARVRVHDLPADGET